MAVLKVTSGRTVRDFRNRLFARIGSSNPRDFTARSEAHWQFWRELHLIPRKRGKSPFKAQNIDAAAELTPKEWREFSERLEKLAQTAA